MGLNVMHASKALVLAAALGSACFRPQSGGSVEDVKMSEKNGNVVREACGAGRWFPAGKTELQKMVNGFIAKAGPGAVQGRITGAIVPHAGYIYSGPVAGYVFRAFRDQAQQGLAPETVVILGFSHRGAFPGVALMDGGAIATPLGKTALDQEAAEILLKNRDRIKVDYRPHYGEHSAENQVPFVQEALPGAKIVLALMGDHDRVTVDQLVGALEDLAKTKKIAVVASSDMLHDPDYNLVTRTDKAVLAKVETMDAEALLREWSYDRQIFCGIGPVVVAMRFAAARGCKKGTVLKYENSGDRHPESRGEWVVGYGAVVFVADKR